MLEELFWVFVVVIVILVIEFIVKNFVVCLLFAAIGFGIYFYRN